MNEAFAMLAVATAKPGQEDELGRRLHALMVPTRAEPGCLRFELHRSASHPAVWMAYEQWRSPADLEAHYGMPHLRQFVAGSHEVLAGELRFERYAMPLEASAGQAQA